MRWRILALLFAARVGLGFQFQTMGAVGGDLSDAFGLDNVQIGVMIGLFMAPGLFLALPAGFVGRFASDRVLAGLGLGALAIGGALSAMAAGPAGVGFGRVVAGAGFLFATLYFAKMTADWFDGREIATAMSVLVMSWPFGIAMGQVGHVLLAETHGWRAPFAVASVWCAVAAVAVMTLYRPPQGLPVRISGGAWGLPPREWGLVVLAGLAWGVFNAGYVVYLSFGPAMLEAQGMGALAAASIISVGSWLMILSGTACGWIADRFGRRDAILAVCMAAAVLALMLLSLPGAGLAASLLFGLVGMAPAGVIMALAGQAVAPERRAFGMGIFFTVYYAVMSASPPIAGWLLDRTEAPDGAILFGAALFALVLPAAVLFRFLGTRAVTAPVQERA
ncbi:CynX/NimT family MFS transporter [Rubrimonas cliftonensis]|uniref:Predicted arabinose efflux permease, MFS family n=1 Tax=Rubrimonas cliftonensis TaxID=89524 RepID=A0A1H4G4C2_9RHOB|nr:MFS transporter [Rubrimonas cliftonensis]SEB04161.1 Predicted arabinose efflux permease, MFS family [Rubrimonas cliftonensis]